MVVFWWEDWRGPVGRPPLTGLIDTVLVAVGGIVSTLVGQAIVEHVDLKDPGFSGGSETRRETPGGRRTRDHVSPEEVPRGAARSCRPAGVRVGASDRARRPRLGRAQGGAADVGAAGSRRPRRAP